MTISAFGLTALIVAGFLLGAAIGALIGAFVATSQGSPTARTPRPGT